MLADCFCIDVYTTAQILLVGNVIFREILIKMF